VLPISQEGHSWRRPPLRDLNNSDPTRSAAARAVEHLRVDVHGRVDLGVAHDLRDHLGRNAVAVRPGRIRSSEREHVARGSSAAWQAGQTHLRRMLLGEIGLPETVEKISSCAAVLFARTFHAASNCNAEAGKGIVRRLAIVFGSSNTPS
jgi:hypothetical protein